MKRWILPAVLALGIHGALFGLNIEWTPPAFTVAENRTVTISLAAAPRAPEPQRPIAPLAPPRARSIKPLEALPLKARPLPKPAPVPPPIDRPDPEPVPPDKPVPPAAAAPIPSKAAPVKTPHPEAAASKASAPSVNQPLGPDQAKVQASVPLYALNPPPAYPAVARRRNYQGTVRLDVLVDRQGRVARIKVAHSSGFALLDQSALKCVRLWRFKPATRSGRPIEMWVQVPVRFALE